MRTLSSGTLSIGRGAGNDWVLPDPDRHLSKTHCAITAEAGQFTLTDLSTNGIFVNDAQQATERDSRVVLSDGDEFRMGEYVISVAAVDDGPALSASTGPLDVDPLDDPLGRRPDPVFQHPIGPVPAKLRGADPFDRETAHPSRTFSLDEDLFRGTPPASDWQGAPQPDHVRATAQAIPPPRAVPAAPPGEIDFDALIGDLKPPGAAWPATPVPPVPAAAAPAVAERDPFAETGGIPTGLPEAGPVTRPPAAAQPPAEVEAPTPGARAGAQQPRAVAQQTGAGVAFAAFLDGAGVLGHGIDESDPEAALRAAGQVFRTMAEGLREVLLSRAAIKGEMRLDRTMIAAHGNNGLKFSVTGDEAVTSLLTPRRPGYMDPLAAAREACVDIKLHELAVMAGVQTALMALLHRFDPDELEKRLNTGMLGSLVQAARKAQFWDLFRQTYADISREAEDDFQAIFGRAFAKAYAAQTRKD